MSFEVKGQIVKILPKETGLTKDGRSWSKQTVVVKVKDGDYENKYAFELSGKALDYFEEKNFDLSDNVSVSFNITVNEYKEKFYTSLRAWKMSLV